MGTVSRVHTFASGAILTAAQLNNEFDNLLTSSAINGGLDATNLGVTAGQATASKALVVDASRNLADATGSNRINNLALSGTFESTGAVTASAGITSGGNIVSDTDSTDDLGTTGVRWANLFVDDVTVTNNVTIGGALTLTGGITLNGNTTIGDSSADTLTVNSTITSNLIFTDATYDIGASGATRPRDLHLSRNALMGGTLGVTGLITATGGVSGALTGNVTGDLSGNVTGGTISGSTGTFSGDLAVDTDTLFVDASADRVGINTASPEESLTVHGGNSTTSTVNITGGAAGNDNATLASDYSMYYQIDANNTVGSRRYEWRVGGKGYSSGSALMSLLSTGNLGLGTVSPTQKLTLSGGSSDVAMLFNSTDTAYNNIGIKKDGSQLRFIEYGNDGTTESANILVLEANGDHVGIGTSSITSGFKLDIADAADGANIKLRTTGTSNAAKQIHFEGYRPNGTAAVLSRLETINKNGAVTLSRIDTNTESVYNSGAITFSTASTGTLAERARITSDGKLCLNRTSGSTALSIDPHATGQPNIQLYNKTNDAYTYLKNDGSAFVIQNSYGTTAGFKPIQFMANGSVNLHIDEVGGSVGIGTSSPSTLLQLNETYGTAALSISDDSSAGDYLTFQIVGGQYNGGANEIQAINTTDLSLNVATARSLIFKTNNTERARILSSGGITFNGDTAAANALNDYEEGTFSIGIEGSTSAGSATISSTAGYYTKIGNVVHAFGFVSWNSATGTGNLKLTGLPFTSSSSSQYYPAGSMTSANLTFSHTITPYVSLGSTFMQIQQSQSGAAGTFVQVDSTAEIYFNVTYFV